MMNSGIPKVNGGGAVILDDASTAIVADYVQRLGDSRTAAHLGVDRQLVVRVLARRPIRRGSAALLTMAIQRVAPISASQRSA